MHFHPGDSGSHARDAEEFNMHKRNRGAEDSAVKRIQMIAWSVVDNGISARRNPMKTHLFPRSANNIQ
jgi:hypothetical protein